MATLAIVTSRLGENSLCFASISRVIYLEKNRAKLEESKTKNTSTLKCNMSKVLCIPQCMKISQPFFSFLKHIFLLAKINHHTLTKCRS